MQFHSCTGQSKTPLERAPLLLFGKIRPKRKNKHIILAVDTAPTDVHIHSSLI